MGYAAGKLYHCIVDNRLMEKQGIQFCLKACQRNIGDDDEKFIAAGSSDKLSSYEGLLHDIGRRTGIAAVRHIIDGYDYAISKDWDEIARVCLTHSYPVKDITKDIGKLDITDEQYRFIRDYLTGIEYDDYDKLIILCDAIADANGFCILEKRFVDTTRRYGIFPFTVDRWNKTIEYKEYFDRLTGVSVYRLLPEIENSLYM